MDYHREAQTHWEECWRNSDHYDRAVARLNALEVERDDLKDENERLLSTINTPHTDDFLTAVPLEAAHQISRWGTAHDVGKTPLDWFWLVGYLAQKAATACLSNDVEKAKHHTISTAAVLLNWFRRLTGDDTSFQPGIDPAKRGAREAEGESRVPDSEVKNLG